MTAAEMEFVIKGRVDSGLQGLSALNSKLDQTKISASGANDALGKASSGLNNITVSAGKASSALAKEAASTTLIIDATNDAAASAGKLSDIVSKGSSDIISANTAVTGSFEDIRGSIDAIADSFKTKWDPIIEQAQTTANVFEQIPASIQGLNEGFNSGALSQELAASALAANELDSAIDQLVNQTAAFLKLDESVGLVLLSIEGLSPELKELAVTGQGSINQLTQAFSLLREKAQFTTDPTQLLNYNLAIEQLSKQITSASKAATTLSPTLAKTADTLSKTGSATGAATQAVGNLGRVLQDLPFGFIGISNNLNPLLESFQRLQAESKKTGTSLIANLGSSLVGGGGIGLALSAVTAAATLASFGFSAWTHGLFDNKKQIDSNKQSTDAYTEAIKSANNAAASELKQVELLVTGLERTNASYQEKKKALEKLQEINSTYFSSLKIEDGLITGLSTSYKNYVDNILAVSKSKAAEAQLEIFNNKLLTVSNNLDNINNALKNTETFRGLANQDKINALLEKNFKTTEDISTLSKLTGLSENRINELLKNRNGLIEDQARLLNTISQVTGNISTKDLLGNLNTAAAKGKIETVDSILKELDERLKGLRIQFKVDGIDRTEDRIKAIQSAIEKLLTINVPEDSTLIKKLFGDIDNLQVDLNLKKLHDKILADMKGLNLAVVVPVDFSVGDSSKIKDSFLDAQLAFFKTITDIQKFAAANHIKITVDLTKLTPEQLKDFEKSLVDPLKKFQNSIDQLSFENISSGIAAVGEALGSGGNPFAALFNTLSEGLKSLGKALIEYGVQVGIIQKIFANPLNPLAPALSIGAGIALEALAALLKSKIPHFAEGGIVSSPVLGLIGERGKEAVIPLDRMSELINFDNKTQVLIAENRISGNDLVTIFKRGEKHNKRTY